MGWLVFVNLLAWSWPWSAATPPAQPQPWDLGTVYVSVRLDDSSAVDRESKIMYANWRRAILSEAVRVLEAKVTHKTRVIAVSKNESVIAPPGAASLVIEIEDEEDIGIDEDDTSATGETGHRVEMVLRDAQHKYLISENTFVPGDDLGRIISAISNNIRKGHNP